MTEEKCKIHFNPDNTDITVDKGTNLLEAALLAGVRISASCGGLGVCGTCLVKIESGTVKSSRTERISEDEYIHGIRQACQCQVLSDLVVTVPVESRLDKAVRAQEKTLSSGVSVTGWSFNPPVVKYYLELPPATLNDNATDYFRLMYGLNRTYGLPDWPSDFEVIRKLPRTLRQDNWKVTVTMIAVSDRPPGQENFTYKITNIEPGDTRSKLYALAIDVGTTTVCAQLLDLNRGEILADTIVFNKQISYGADVITRIMYCQKQGGLPRLQELVVASINEAIDDLLSHSRINRKDISHITVAGNTTMQHILMGLDPKYIRLSPYTPVANFIPLTKASPLGIKVPDHVHIFNFPSVSSYVGGDIVSGIVASGMHQRERLTFYMDIGTNGEIVIGNSEWMVSASCSAGPAFEGGGIKHGMVAMSGAIQDFSLDPETLEPAIKTIDDSRPKGICGSGLISILAELLLNGIVSPNGKFNTASGTKRIRQGNDGLEYVVAWAKETQTEQDITISEVDIDCLIRAKAAMYAGFATLSRNVGVSYEDFDQVILAGNFGNSLDIERAITIGLLPDLPRDRFVFVGNGSLSGARLVNYSTDILDQSRSVAQMMTNIELSENNDFTENYIAALFLPHTNEKAFPSIMELLKKRHQQL
jgi:uncharacterized 2Fe-2S/4Fe-4S cluster protein (DUF4445 family)